MPPTLAQVESLFTNGTLAAAGAAAVSIPIVIHLLTRFRRRPQAWGAMRFIMLAYRRHKRRLQLEQLILLAVRCLVLALLGLALAGPLVGSWASGVGIDAGGRLVCLVVDDGLGSRAVDAGGDQRFERLRASALRLVDQLGTSDRVALWRGGRPGEPIVATATLDHNAIKRELNAMSPRYSRSALADTLTLVSRSLEDQAFPKDRTFVVLLSALSADALPVERPASAELVKLGEQARVLAARPAATVGNIQIEQLQPRRRMVLAAGTDAPAAIPVAIKLRRFADESADTTTTVKLSVTADADSLTAGGVSAVELASAEVQHRWAAGQRDAVINKDLLVKIDALSGAGSAGRAATGGGASVIVRAEADDDALNADNRRYATVELRRRLLVGIVDDRTQRLTGPADGFTPERWLTFALAPRSADGLGAAPVGGVELTHASAPTLNAEAIGAWDAALVLRPDLLTADGWTALRRLVLRGGVAWLFVPKESVSSSWTEAAPRQLGRDWTLGIEPIEAGESDAVVPELSDVAVPDVVATDVAVADLVEAPSTDPAVVVTEGRLVTLQPADATADQPSTPSEWQLATDTPTPEPLRLLSADWQALLSPLRVSRRLDVTVRGGADEVWLRLANKERSPLMVVSGMGDGHLVLLATAVDPDWSNLPTKPVFVPLLHETVRGLLGRSSRASQDQVCGNQPVLPLARWEGAQQLVLRQTASRGGASDDSDAGQSVLLRRRNEGFTTVTPLTLPGVYVGAPGMSARKLAVNVDPVGGDTRALDEQAIESLLDSVGEWRWLDEEQPAKSLLAYTARANIGWPLLWVVMALVLVELCLARWFSHATTGAAERTTALGGSGAASMLARAADRVRGGQR